MNERRVEVLVGLFILAGMLALLLLAFKVSGLSSSMGGGGYYISAGFDNIGSLRVRAPVSIGGVRVGEVSCIHLDKTTFKAVVTMQINRDENNIPVDSSASILTQGLLGANYISLSPGYENTYLKNGDQLINTHPALILENLIGQLLFSIKNSSTKGDGK